MCEGEEFLIEIVEGNSVDENEADQPQSMCTMPAMVHLLLCFILMWQYTFLVSEAGISILIVFFFHFFCLLDFAGEHFVKKCFVDWWPRSVPKAKQMLKLVRASNIIEYVVCPHCDALYNIENCFEKRGSEIVMKSCKRTIGRKEYGTQLVRKVQHPKSVSVVPL